MDEAEWEVSTDLEAMLDLFAPAGSERKLRLFACAICRLLPGYLDSEPDRAGLELTELDVDERVDDEAFDAIDQRDNFDMRWYRRDGWGAVGRAYSSYHDLQPDPRLSRRKDQKLPDLLREVMGNPHRPRVVDPAWMTDDVETVARAAYTERSLPSGHLDAARLAILADALEDACCADGELLSHLRSAGPHVRGCWALDLILGKQ